jgi:hypothetical protein
MGSRMTDVYEFHIAGLISPVVRAALPELVTGTGSRDTMLTGRVTEPGQIQDLLARLNDNGLTATHIVIASRARWQRSLRPACGLASASGSTHAGDGASDESAGL